MPAACDALIERALAERAGLAERWFPDQAPRLARLCHAMAERFARGGRLLAAARDAAGRSDAAHVEVEFVHPVIVGKRALPALAVDSAALALLAEPDDIVMVFGDEPAEDVAVARAAGALTVAFGAGSGAEWEFAAPGDDPFIAQEAVETLYHVLWELVHVFFEHRGLLEGRTPQADTGGGSASFLYPFLDEAESDLDKVLADVEGSVVMKARETHELRVRTLGDGTVLAAAAAAARDALAAGGRLLALGNGGSATDCMDLVADMREPPAGRDLTPLPAIDLTSAAAILTAVGNDVGIEPVFTRQLIAHGRPGDVVVAISTSGGSRNVLHALERARKDGLTTIALVGYDGGQIVSGGLADHIVGTPSEHIPRIQEAQATVLHLMRALLEPGAAGRS